MDRGFISEVNLPDKLVESNDSVFFNACGLRYEVYNERVINKVYTTILPSDKLTSSIDLKQEPGSLITHTINPEDINVYICSTAQISIESIAGSRGNNKLLNDVSRALHSRDSFVKILSLKDALEGGDNTDIESGVLSSEIIEALREVQNNMKYVTSTIKSPDAYHVFPDIKLFDRHSDTNMISTAITDNALAFPSRNGIRMFGNPHGLTNKQRLPANGGDIFTRFDTLTDLFNDDPTSINEDNGTKKEFDALKDLDPGTLKRRASWTFTTVPHTSTAAPAGSADTLASGIGICLLIHSDPIGTYINDLDGITPLVDFPTGLYDEDKATLATSGVSYQRVLFITLDYTSEFVKQWYRDNTVVTTTVSEDFGHCTSNYYREAYRFIYTKGGGADGLRRVQP